MYLIKYVQSTFMNKCIYLNKYFLNTSYVASTVPGTREITVDKNTKILALVGVIF